MPAPFDLGASRSQNQQVFAPHSKFSTSVVQKLVLNNAKKSAAYATAEAAKQAATKAAAEQAKAQKKQAAAQDKAAVVAGQVVSSGDACPAEATKEEATVQIGFWPQPQWQFSTTVGPAARRLGATPPP